MNFLERFEAADRKIVQSIRDSSIAIEMRDRAKTARSYQKWNQAVYDAQDAHTAAWQERNQVSAEYDVYYQATYGPTPVN